MALFTRSSKNTARQTQLPESTTAAAAGHVSGDGHLPDAGEALPPADPKLEATTRQIGGELLDAARRNKSGFLSAAFWSDKLMDWTMKDEAFKVQFFRFIDAFPVLKTPEQIHEHLIDYLSQPGVTLPPGFGTGMKLGGLAK